MDVKFVTFTLTYSTEGNKFVLSGINTLVVGPHSPHVGSTVDQPGGIKNHGVPQQAWDKISHPQTLAPEVPRHQRGDEEAHHQYGQLVVPEVKNKLECLHSYQAFFRIRYRRLISEIHQEHILEINTLTNVLKRY